jgi:glycosyltransferase involved in cell wall biosynthesis
MDGNLAARERLSPEVKVEFPDIRFKKRDTLANILRFRKLLRRFSPDLLLTYNWGSIEWAMANFLAPVCGHVHLEDGFGPDEAVTQKPARVWFRRIFLRRVSKLIVPSTHLRRIALETWKLPAGRVEYVPNGVDLEQFNSHPPAAAGGWVVGTIATLRKEKNIPLMLEAFRALPAGLNVELHIAGAGPELEPLRALVDRQGLAGRVKMLGYRLDPAPVMAGLHVFCISSDTEQMPLSVLEAMAAGIPVVGTDVGDIKNMVSDRNKPFITPKGDAGALAASMERLLTDSALAREVGEANRLRCRAVFDKLAMYAHHDKVYRAAIG